MYMIYITSYILYAFLHGLSPPLFLTHIQTVDINEEPIYITCTLNGIMQVIKQVWKWSSVSALSL